MFCPNCGKEVEENQKYCSNCGYCLLEEEERQDKETNKENKSSGLFDILIPIIVIGLILTGLFLSFMKSDEVSNFFKNDSLEPPKAENCESKLVTDLAVSIFEENDYYFKLLEPYSISDVYLKYPQEESYDSSTDKYTCSGTIVVTAQEEGFLPLENDNDYYKKTFYLKWNDDKTKLLSVLKKYNQYTCKIEYTSQISEGQTLVNSSFCGSENVFDTSDLGKFSCIGDCEDTILTQESDNEENQQDQNNQTDSLNNESEIQENNTKTNIEEEKPSQEKKHKQEIENNQEKQSEVQSPKEVESQNKVTDSTTKENKNEAQIEEENSQYNAVE